MRLQKNWKKDLLSIMTSYWPSHINTKDTIAWVTMQVKYYYDINWQPWFFVVRDEVLLQLHCRYKLPEITNWKLEQQFIELFKVIKWIGHLIYCLNLSLNWLIHDVIFIAHLESAHTNDSYNRSQSDHLSTVTVNEVTTDDHYEIEQLLWKWVSCWSCEFFTEYLVQWKGYELKFNIWYNLKDLREAKELVREYNECITEEQEEALL